MSHDVLVRKRWRGHLLTACVLLALACLALSAVRTGDAEEGESKPRVFALLIGCTEYVYSGFRDLDGCENDVVLMAKTLRERLLVPKENITMLKGWGDTGTQPSQANIRAELDKFASRSYRPNDRVIILYAGHGVQQRDDDNPADEMDGKDEAWLPSDGRIDRVAGFAGTIRDEEIGECLDKIRAQGASVWLIMDCCHSATGMRGTPEDGTTTKFRGIDAAAVGVTIEPAPTPALGDGHEDTPMEIGSGDKGGVVAFYAAQSYQQVPEVTWPRSGPGRKPHGLLTSAVVEALNASGDQLTFAELYERVVAGYRLMGQQHVVAPLAEGDLDQGVFTGEAAKRPLGVRRDKKKLRLSAGELHGVSKGTELEVYTTGDPTDVQGRVVVVSAGTDRSDVRCVEGTDASWVKSKDTQAWSARIIKYALGKTSLPLALVDEKEQPVGTERVSAEVREVLERDSVKVRCPLVATPDKAKWVLEIDADGAPIAINPAYRGRAAPHFHVDMDSDDNSLDKVLFKIYKGENILKLAGRGTNRLPPGLDFRVRRIHRNGERAPVQPGARLPPGSRLEFGLFKKKGNTLDVFVFWVDAHYTITQVYPYTEDGETPRIEKTVVTKKDPIKIGLYDEGEIVTDDTQGEEKIIVFAAPWRPGEPELDLSFLAQEGLVSSQTRGTEPSEEEALLRQLAGKEGLTRGTWGRSKRTDTRLHMRVFTFKSRWGRIRVPPATPDAVKTSIAPSAQAPGKGVPPDAWHFGPSVRLARAGAKNARCLLVAEEGKRSKHVLVDLDGEVDAGTPEQLKALVAQKERGFDAEMAIRIEPHRVIAWYDTDNDRAFDVVLIDGDNDHRAEERYRRSTEDGAKDGWMHDTGIDIALLSTGHLSWEWLSEDDDWRAIRIEALERVFALAGDD